MSTITDEATFDIDIACSLSAAEQSERGREFTLLLADAEDIAEQEDGYALKFANRDSWVTRAVELIVAERKCCPFFRFTLAFEPEEGPVWLHIAGPGEVKEFIREQVVPAHLRPAARRDRAGQAG
jgi:hypothetical protein